MEIDTRIPRLDALTLTIGRSCDAIGMTCPLATFSITAIADLFVPWVVDDDLRMK